MNKMLGTWTLSQGLLCSSILYTLHSAQSCDRAAPVRPMHIYDIQLHGWFHELGGPVLEGILSFWVHISPKGPSTKKHSAHSQNHCWYRSHIHPNFGALRVRAPDFWKGPFGFGVNLRPEKHSRDLEGTRDGKHPFKGLRSVYSPSLGC